MKHSLKVTLILIAMFAIAQIIGLLVVNSYYQDSKWQPLPSVAGVALERPDVSPLGGLVYLAGAIGVGTLLILFLIKYSVGWLWRLWFFLAVTICLHIAFSSFAPMPVALAMAVALGAWKILRPNIIIHNVTELFMYGGLAALFAPMLNVAYAFGALALLSAYDMYAVWQSKHMIKMAKFQAGTGIFAGLLLPYHAQKGIMLSRQTPSKKPLKAGQWRTAVLGGGDIGFPLIFSSAVLASSSLNAALAIVPFTTAALAGLLFLAKKDRFYPAMPFLSAGCVLGFSFAWMIGLL